MSFFDPEIEIYLSWLYFLIPFSKIRDPRVTDLEEGGLKNTTTTGKSQFRVKKPSQWENTMQSAIRVDFFGGERHFKKMTISSPD